MSGLMTLDDLVHSLQHQGFSIGMCEDHSYVLKSFVASLLMEGGVGGCGADAGWIEGLEMLEEGATSLFTSDCIERSLRI